jgi:hypothetical protein
MESHPARDVAEVSWRIASSSVIVDEHSHALKAPIGTTPDGADVGVAPAPLGTAYRVTVLRAGGEAISLGGGSAVFTP